MFEELRSVFEQSFTLFLERETKNILNGTAERNLCACWAPLLENAAIEAGIQGYRADADYNRKQDGKVKTMLAHRYYVVRIVCDLILHSRGEIPGRDNLIAIEMKRSTRPTSEKEEDRLRLRTLTQSSYDGIWSADGKTLPEHVCGYALGYFVEFDVNARVFLIEEYAEGALHSSRTHFF
ncbi:MULTISPECIES: hypothetical protein [Sphingopyxis]|uniref:hypothetical protein n=1 Tax=Sphingopyxis TaxID=165697 RepID=UPI001C2BF5AB|nr:MULTISPECIES: hypothetical protein [Sphingopyxis]QXF12794.1 hypothetical protein HBA51_11935 [Sphingopyxis terrae subsp. terrae]